MYDVAFDQSTFDLLSLSFSLSLFHHIFVKIKIICKKNVTQKTRDLC